MTPRAGIADPSGAVPNLIAARRGQARGRTALIAAIGTIRHAVLALAVAASAPVHAAEVAVPDGYRQDHYRAPVPDTLDGATVVDDDAAFALWKTGAVVFVDVMPRPPKPELPKGTIFRQKPRHGIPGSIWLPNVGYGRLAGETDAYFRAHLARATGSAETPVLFFCLRDCWMSWNAAKRAAVEYGYTRVFWYPEGTDGWEFADYPVERIEPEPPLEE